MGTKTADDGNVTACMRECLCVCMLVLNVNGSKQPSWERADVRNEMCQISG